MGILDDAKDKLQDATEWVKDKATDVGENAQAAGATIGEKAADAKHWVESKVGSETAGDDVTQDATTEWVEQTGSATEPAAPAPDPAPEDGA